jgi:hypothetical protein
MGKKILFKGSSGIGAINTSVRLHKNKKASHYKSNYNIIISGQMASNNTISSINHSTIGINNREVIESGYPVALINKTDSDLSYAYKINLPSNNNIQKGYSDYVYTIQINGSFTEFELKDTGIISDDINSANSYFFNTHFVHDTTWEPRIIPPITSPNYSPYKVKCYNTESNVVSASRSSIEIFNNSDVEYFIYIKVTLKPKSYIAGTLKMIYGDIYPATLTDFYENFTFSVEKLNL